MADFTITVSNHLPVTAPEEVTLWGTLEWGTDNWGWVNERITDVIKVLSNTSTITTAIVKDVEKVLNESTTITTAIFKDYVLSVIANSLTVSDALDELKLIDSNGYYTVFIGNTTDGADRPNTTYTKLSDPSDSWSTVSGPTTTWS